MENKFAFDAPNYSGSIPAHYEQYLGPLFFEPYAIEVTTRINTSAVRLALEIACGTGRITRHLRSIIPSEAVLVASDISKDMLNVARKKLQTLQIDWQIIDAQQLPFPDNSIDVIVCGFGYMFVPDKTKAFTEAYRVLKPGGTFIFTTWDRLENNGASNVYRQIVKGFFGDALPISYNLPFSMYDHQSIRNLLKAGGFSKIDVENVQKLSICKSARHAAYGLARGGTIYNEIMKREPKLLQIIETKLKEELTEKFGDSKMRAPMSAVISRSQK